MIFKERYMKFKQFIKHLFLNILPEQLSILKKNIIRLYRVLVKKGREHLTVMLIPHSEKQIFTLHISYFFLFFAGIILAVIIFIASINILSTSTTKQEVINLTQLSKNWKLKDKLIREQIDNLNSSVESLKPEIEKLYSSAASSKGEFVNLFAKGGSGDINEITNSKLEKLLPIEDKLPDEYYDLKEIKDDLILSKKYVERVYNFIKERETMFSKIPSIWPLKVGGYITSDYGWRRNPISKRQTEFHRGLDIASWPGAPVIATAAGQVIFTGPRGGYGLVVIIQHEYGFQTYYAHLSRILTYKGKTIKKGEIVGLLGSTGNSTGYHLHYEVRIGMNDVNPWPFIINIK